MLVGVVAVLLGAVLIGGLFDIGRGSVSYHRDVNRSYAAQAAVLVATSNRQGDEVQALMDDMPNLTRVTLGARLESLVTAGTRVATSAAALEPPAPTVSGFATAMEQRADALADLRSAVDGLLSLNGSLPLAASVAASRVTAAGALMARADQRYAEVRRGFRTAPGTAHLPRSVWVPDAQLWAAGPAATLVSELSAAPTLSPTERVVLLPSTVSLTPTAVPRVTPGATSVVPPTHALGVSVVVVDRGNVAMGRATVSAKVVPQGAGAPAAASARVTLEPTSRVTVTLPKLAVAPGDTYTLTVSVIPPAGQADLATTSLTYAVEVAPPTPPSTTTTTAPRTTTTAPPTTTTAPPPPTTVGGGTPSSRPGA